METNCFVRTLKVEINNDNLPRINTLHMSITKEGDYYFTLPGVNKLEVIGNGYLIQGGEDRGRVIDTYDGTQFQVHCVEPLKLLVTGMSDANGVFYIYDQHHTANNKYITFNLEEALQNSEQYESFRIGSLSPATMGKGCACTGDVTDMIFNAQSLYMGGCDKLRGSLNNVIKYQANEDNLQVVGFTGTKLKFNLSSLAGKYYLYIKPANDSTTGDVKYFGDTRNRYIDIAAKGSRNMTGTVEELVQRLIARNRTGDNDSVYFFIGSESIPTRFTKVTYNNISLNQYYKDYIAQHPTPNSLYMVFTWNALGDISYSITSTDPDTPYIPLNSTPIP